MGWYTAILKDDSNLEIEFGYFFFDNLDFSTELDLNYASGKQCIYMCLF